MSEGRSGGYWDREGTTKTFSHPVNLDRLRENLDPESKILDYAGGIIYISDYWLQSDERNRERYARYLDQYRTYGVFEVSEGVAVRHHSPGWIESLLTRWERIALDDIRLRTMNGHEAVGFQQRGT